MTERVWAQSDTLDDLFPDARPGAPHALITNIVAANFTANVLLAVGASPAMVVATEEVAEFAAIAAAVLINVGTVILRSSEAMLRRSSHCPDSREAVRASTDDSTAAIPCARELAKRTGAVVAISGVLDYIIDGSDVMSVAGGDAIMTRVTGVGCALGALMACRSRAF